MCILRLISAHARLMPRLPRTVVAECAHHINLGRAVAKAVECKDRRNCPRPPANQYPHRKTARNRQLPQQARKATRPKSPPATRRKTNKKKNEKVKTQEYNTPLRHRRKTPQFIEVLLITYPPLFSKNPHYRFPEPPSSPHLLIHPFTHAPIYSLKIHLTHNAI